MKGLIFTYVLTYGGSLVSLVKPYVGFLIYVGFSIIRPESLWHWSVPAGNYSRIVAIALLVGWAINGMGDWRFGQARPIIGAFIAYWIWACISATQARDSQQAWNWVEGQGKILLPFVVGLTLITSTRQLKQLAWVIVLAHGYVSYDLNVSYYSGFNRIQEIGFGGMDNNSFAISLVACTGLAFFLGLNSDKWWQKVLAFVSAGLMVHSVFFAFSRGGMLALIITAVVSFVLIPKRWSHYFTFAAMILIALRLAGPEVVERFVTVFASRTERDASAQSRLDLWQICIAQMNQHPLLGLGPHHFPIHAHEFGLTPGKEAHSLWLQIGAELGIPGLVFIVSFYGICVIRLWPFVRGKYAVADPWFTDSARMVIAALTGFAVSAQFVSLPGLETPYYIVLLGAGTLKLATNSPPVATSRTVYYRGIPVNRFRTVHTVK